jgi:hypothetical protein
MWEHFEGENRPGTEGLSNLYITGFWRVSGHKALRARTGIWRSARVSALNIWPYVNEADRFYYQCWLHWTGTPQDRAIIGFVMDHPLQQRSDDWQHIWSNRVLFREDGQVNWATGDRTDGGERVFTAWPQGKEYACLLRVELDFQRQTASVWINGKLRATDLPIRSKHFDLEDMSGEALKLERWGFVGPGASTARRYEPLYLDIDDLEFGTWEYRASNAPRTDKPLSP